jgi:hypothetical protein
MEPELTSAGSGMIAAGETSTTTTGEASSAEPRKPMPSSSAFRGDNRNTVRELYQCVLLSICSGFHEREMRPVANIGLSLSGLFVYLSRIINCLRLLQCLTILTPFSYSSTHLVAAFPDVFET